MKLQVALGFLAAICISCVIAFPEGSEPKKQCERVFPLMPWRQLYRLNCKYLCKGWPFRYGNEPDGIPCGPAQPVTGRRDVCMDGKCISFIEANWIINRRNYGTTKGAAISEEIGTSYEPTTPKEHFTTPFPETTEISSHGFYATSERSLRTTGAAAIDVSATSMRPAIGTKAAATTASASETTFETQTDKASEASTKNISPAVSKTITATTTSAIETTFEAQTDKASEIFTTSIIPTVPKTVTVTPRSASKTTLETQTDKVSEASTTNISPEVPKAIPTTTRSATETTFATQAHKAAEVSSTSVRPDVDITTASAPMSTTEEVQKEWVPIE